MCYQLKKKMNKTGKYMKNCNELYPGVGVKTYEFIKAHCDERYMVCQFHFK